jgi:hypothetical protein
VASASVSDLSTNISIDHCVISNPTGGAPGFPRLPITSRGGLNSGISITNNNIFNWLGTAVSLVAGSNCTISNNSFYMTTTDSVIGPVIYLQMSGGGHVISGNSIGGSAPDRSGTPLKYGSTGSGFIVMYLSLGSSAPSSIQGNVIGNVIADVGSSFSSPFVGMSLPAGSFPNVNIGTVTGNIIGGAAVTGNARDTIGLPSGSGFSGISCTNTGGIVYIENNVISNVVANPVTGTMQAIIATGSYPKTIRNNVIREITASCNGSGTPSTFLTPCGIIVGGGSSLSDVVNIDGNKIFNITNASTVGSANLVGLFVTSSRGVTVQRNHIYDLHATGSSSPLMWGMYVKGSISGTLTVRNNMIALGSSSNDVAYVGIEDAVAHGGASNNYFFNSVSMMGTATGTNGTCAFNRSGFANLTFKDNIVSNTRSGGTGNHIAIANTNATATGWTASSSNYNDLHSSSAGMIGQWLDGGVPLTFAGWKASSGGDAQSVSGAVAFVSTTDLHVNVSDSIVANRGIPVAGITTDYDGETRNATTPDIGADEFAGGSSTVTLGVQVAQNWNIVSLPVSSPIPDDSVKHIFVNSLNPYAFAFVGGYVQRFTMSNGPGYWIKSSLAYTQNITGTQRDTLTVPVAALWNMIGSISTSIDTSAAHVTPSVAGLRGSNFFKYANGYVVATTIEPGLGYWVKANSAGSFFMHATGPAAKAQPEAAGTERSIEDLNTLTIQDANGGSQTLYFGTDGNNEIPVAMFAMPPAPPEGSFDARFESSEGGLMVQTHPVEVSTVIDLPITVQSSAYPLTVSWSLKGDGSYELSEGATSHLVRGEGALRIANNEVRRFVLKVTGSSSLPKEFALSQNYPNPFNPTTNIKYALPVGARVRVSVYNVLGQLIATLKNEVQGAGYYTVPWNGKNHPGFDVSSGVYFYRIEAKPLDGRGEFTSIKKMMFLR